MRHYEIVFLVQWLKDTVALLKPAVAQYTV